MNENYAVIISDLYNELRWYRSKEYQTFLFSVPVIGVGFSKDFSSVILTAALFAFAVLTLYYLWANIVRMDRLKLAIVTLQKMSGAHDLLIASGIDPEKWANKPWYKHLGTFTYTIIILAEVLALCLYTLNPSVVNG